MRKLRIWGPRVALGALGVILGLALGWEAIREVDWAEVWTATREFPPTLFLASLLLLLTAYYMSAIRWRLLLSDGRVGVTRLFLIETATIGLNNISPIRVLAEPAQIAILSTRDGINPGVVLASRGAARFLDGVVTVVIIWGGILVVPGLAEFWMLAAIATGVAGAGVLLIFVLGLAPRRFERLRHWAPVQGFERGVRGLKERPGRTGVAFLLSAFYLPLIGLTGVLIAIGIGHPLGIPLGIIAVLGPLFFGTSVPGLPAALGTYEFASRFLLERAGVPAEPAISFAILAHFLLFFTPMVFTVVVLPKEGVGTLRSLSSLLRGVSSR